MADHDEYDLLILVDATSSMGTYLASLQKSLPQIISISSLTHCFSRIGLLAYRDYCDRGLLDWSGWVFSDPDAPVVDLIAAAKNMIPLGGGDAPEATKTGLARAYELMRPNATTLILLYTDAPPHTPATGSMSDRSSNLAPEQRALKDVSSYGGFGPSFSDWVSASKMFTSAGQKRGIVFSILDRGLKFPTAGFYMYLSTITGGTCFSLWNNGPDSISTLTIEILLAWMGVDKTGSTTASHFHAHLATYVSTKNIHQINSETDTAASQFFQVPYGRPNGSPNICDDHVGLDLLKKCLPKKEPPVQSFAKRYASDEVYKKIATEQIRKIIVDDVSVISINPVFGSLWRAICNDRSNEFREELTTAFGLQVDRISNSTEKARMKTWLDESYDYTAEVLETIGLVPQEKRFPCVFLDPTLVFPAESNETPKQGGGSAPGTLFRRDELLEIGRSCDYKVLRRLGRILTRLSYVHSADEMPTHIAAVPENEIPRIPMALASPEYNRRFWGILLHIIVPGTMLASRPAALLAALSIRLGIQPLLEAADQEMLLWRDRWNNVEIPETWNVSCMSLLIDADEAYKRRQGSSPESAGLLRTHDRALFERLVSYKMLEMNLETTLLARLGWTPQKSSFPLGPVVNCKSCDFPRSVTMMGKGGLCGYCLWTDFATAEERDVCLTANVTKNDKETTSGTWVECSMRNCRGQYVLYRPETLRVRPKCHYCRHSLPAPKVECSQCLNKIIWPEEYRPSTMADYKCSACTSGRKTIIDVETTASKINAENSTEWLLRNDNKIPEPFNHQSIFRVISTAGVENFCEKVELFPARVNLSLCLNGKPIRNVESLLEQLVSWVSRRRAESGTCSLCFSSMRKSNLAPACGRSGCNQRICGTCLEGWYGLNAPGQVINTAALSCPFCRRAPTGKTLAKYGMGVHAVADLRLAVARAGEWIFAWCRSCDHAKEYAERVCAQGPVELNHWVCEGCQGTDNALGCVKECPGCGTATEKISGCGHITCPVPGCGAHWCYFCGKKFDQNSIYAHMNEAHDGFYADGDDGDDGDEEHGFAIFD